MCVFHGLVHRRKRNVDMKISVYDVRNWQLWNPQWEQKHQTCFPPFFSSFFLKQRQFFAGCMVTLYVSTCPVQRALNTQSQPTVLLSLIKWLAIFIFLVKSIKNWSSLYSRVFSFGDCVWLCNRCESSKWRRADFYIGVVCCVVIDCVFALSISFIFPFF